MRWRGPEQPVQSQPMTSDFGAQPPLLLLRMDPKTARILIKYWKLVDISAGAGIR
jgi:hypothetical protein